MLKLNASYSKKVPAGEEYSSQSYHASVEIELPDGLTQDQLQRVQPIATPNAGVGAAIRSKAILKILVLR